MNRRRYLALVGSGLVLSTAGCIGDDGDSGNNSIDRGGNNDGNGGENGTDNTTSDSNGGDNGADDTTGEGSENGDGDDAGDVSEDNEAETEAPPPEFEATIDAPDTVETGEEWTFEVQITNTGGPGEFRSPVSFKINESEWERTDGPVEIALDANETEETEFDDLVFDVPLILKYRLDRVDVTSTTEVVWGNPYDPDSIRDIASSPDYDEFFRNFESYRGEAVRFEFGAIYQAIYPESVEENPTGRDYYQMSVSNNGQEYGGDIAADWYGDKRLLEDDIIELWGVAEELYSYETVQGDTRTVPRITMTDVEIREE